MRLRRRESGVLRGAGDVGVVRRIHRYCGCEIAGAAAQVRGIDQRASAEFNLVTNPLEFPSIVSLDRSSGGWKIRRAGATDNKRVS